MLTVYILVALVCGGVLFLAVHKGFSSAEEGLPYRLRSSVFNKSEEAFFIELKNQLPAGFQVFPKIRIIDFIEPTSQELKWRNKIWAKHVDYLICNSSFKPVMAIELNGKSHLSTHRIDRDAFVAGILKVADLSLVTVPVGTEFRKSIEIVTNKLLSNGSANRTKN